jgi:hypothetical protein
MLPIWQDLTSVPLAEQIRESATNQPSGFRGSDSAGAAAKRWAFGTEFLDGPSVKPGPHRGDESVAILGLLRRWIP